ncbi:hypothetical protein ABW19_dt0205857 [Dactylella cylindrospora]|nr:hypothetical protein ABW19_dt0205857 [Dactylella cylindrospora]
MFVAKPYSTLVPKCSFLTVILPLTDKPFSFADHPRYAYQSRFYATHTEPLHHRHRSSINWPDKPHTQLTPYEIFDQPHSSAYKKTTFYQLVKLYHPDIALPSNHPSASLSKAIRTERFRLVVAANAILADPSKKKAYDTYGVGWNSRHSAARDPRRRTAATYADGPWKHSPAGNATWEDWERWYRAEGMGGYTATAENPEDTQPLTSNTNFVTIILLISISGILIQLARFDTYSSRYEERRDRRDREISRQLFRLRREGDELGGKDGRVQAFLRMRDPEGYGGGVEAVREEKLRRLLPEGEVCMSDDTRSKDLD